MGTSATGVAAGEIDWGGTGVREEEEDENTVGPLFEVKSEGNRGMEGEGEGTD